MMDKMSLLYPVLMIWGVLVISQTVGLNSAKASGHKYPVLIIDLLYSTNFIQNVTFVVNKIINWITFWKNYPVV